MILKFPYTGLRTWFI